MLETTIIYKWVNLPRDFAFPALVVRFLRGAPYPQKRKVRRLRITHRERGSLSAETQDPTPSESPTGSPLRIFATVTDDVFVDTFLVNDLTSEIWRGMGTAPCRAAISCDINDLIIVWRIFSRTLAK
jgi:hypothetical protein